MPLYWLGHPCKQNAADLWRTQELIVVERPDVILELGTGFGGTAIFYASVCDLLGSGRVVTVDRQTYQNPLPIHRRISWVYGDLASDDIVARIHADVKDQRVLMIHDAAHDLASVRRDLERYADLVAPGGHLIVNDTNQPECGQAVKEWLATHPDFSVNTAVEPVGTWHPGGWLVRRA